MTDLFNAIEARIKARLPESDRIQTVDYWNNQIQAQLDKKQASFRYNAIFVEFQVTESRSVGLGVKDKTLVVRFHFALKSLKADKRENLAFFERFSQVFEGWASPSNQSPTFGSFREIAINYDTDHDGVGLPSVEYRTTYRDISGYYYLNGGTTSGLTLAAAAGIEDVTPTTPVAPTNVVENTDGSFSQNVETLFILEDVTINFVDEDEVLINTFVYPSMKSVNIDLT